MAPFKFASPRRTALTALAVTALAGALSIAGVAATVVGQPAASTSAVVAATATTTSSSSTLSAHASSNATPATSSTATPTATASAPPATYHHAPLDTSSPTAGATRRPEPLVSASQFVTRSGTNLMLDGHVWQFVGYDDYRLSSTPSFQCGDTTSAAQLASILDEIHNNSGATVIRVPMEQTYGGPGNWTTFDTILTAASQRGMKVVPVLADQYGTCDTFPGQTVQNKVLSWYQGGYRQPTPGSSLSYRDFAIAMATHYADNPTIAFWQLMNEASDSTTVNPETCDEHTAALALRAFADDVAGAIKAADPNHLVNLGTIGSGQCGASGSTDYQYVHAGLIDICEVHDYGSILPVPGDQWNGVQTRINDCHADGKPIWAGEEGLDASIQPNGSTSGVVTAASLALRASTFAAKMQAQFALGLAGFVVWEFNPNASDTSWTITPGDPTEGALAAKAAELRSTNGV